MPAPAFRVGDCVIYTDLDAVEWGPWEVVAVSDDMISVRANGKLDFPIESSSLRKVEEMEQVSPREE